LLHHDIDRGPGCDGTSGMSSHTVGQNQQDTLSILCVALGQHNIVAVFVFGLPLSRMCRRPDGHLSH